ncbi:MAG: hypothetical protein L0312_17065, partial [Acidobacteria bacterium]|nr:hypothetical protein [Acidobacteriota bacterium]
VRCEQSRRRPVNGSGECCAELDVGGWLKKRVRASLQLLSCRRLPAKKRARMPQDALAKAWPMFQHPRNRLV